MCVEKKDIIVGIVGNQKMNGDIWVETIIKIKTNIDKDQNLVKENKIIKDMIQIEIKIDHSLDQEANHDLQEVKKEVYQMI